MFKKITSLDKFNNLCRKEKAALFYFSHENCNVCKVLKPKVAELIKRDFSEIKLYQIDTKENVKIAAQNSIFANPVILIYFQGKVFYRKARNIGINELKNTISKPYTLLFEK